MKLTTPYKNLINGKYTPTHTFIAKIQKYVFFYLLFCIFLVILNTINFYSSLTTQGIIMAMFDFRHFDSDQSTELMHTTSKLAQHANIASFAKLIPDGLKGINAALTLPDGWRSLTPAELNLPNSAVDIYGYYTFVSTITGDRPINGSGPQVMLVGEFDDAGKPTRLGISWAGTNDLLDVADYFHLNEGKIAP